MPLEPTPLLAAIHYEIGFDINQTMRDVVMHLRKDGFAVGGVIQETEVDADSCFSSINIVDIRSGEAARITQEQGKESRGCKLDPRGLASISHCITDAIDAGVDLIVINKFGRAESEGGGLLSCIAAAISAGLPVLTTVRQPYRESWHAFHGGLATELLPSLQEIIKWCEVARTQVRALRVDMPST